MFGRVRIFLLILMTALAAVMPGHGVSASVADGDGPMQVHADPAAPWVGLALDSNADLSAISLRVEALEAAAQGSRRWADPMVSLEYSNVPWNAPTLGQSPMSGLQVRVTQSLTLPGVNDAREELARARVSVQSAAYAEAQSRLAASVRSAYWQLAESRAQLEVTARHITLVEELLLAVEGRYAAGFGDQGALLRLRLLRDRLEDSQGEYERDGRVLVASLNGAMGRGPAEPLETVPLEGALAPPQRALEEMMEQALAHRGELARYQAKAAVAREQATLASRQRFSEFQAWGGYRLRSNALSDGGLDFISFGVGAPLPFDKAGRWEAEQRAAELRAQAAEREYEQALHHLKADLSGALATWARAFEREAAYSQELLPLGRDAVESTLASFQTGQVGFEALYQAEIALLELERAILLARMQTRVEAATVAALLGEVK